MWPVEPYPDRCEAATLALRRDPTRGDAVMTIPVVDDGEGRGAVGGGWRVPEGEAKA